MPLIQSYSPYFSTLHNEPSPIGNLGRGTHYSILRCAEWFDVSLQRISSAQIHDFSVIWDEDHDERVIHAIEQLYFEGLLAPVQFIGERKANLTVIVAAKFFWSESEATVKQYIQRVSEIADNLDFDCWNSEVGSFDRSIGSPQQTDFLGIIADNDQRVETYLRNIDSLWSLGTKKYHPIKVD
jgi:hypothetical protein